MRMLNNAISFANKYRIPTTITCYFIWSSSVVGIYWGSIGDKPFELLGAQLGGINEHATIPILIFGNTLLGGLMVGLNTIYNRIAYNQADKKTNKLNLRNELADSFKEGLKTTYLWAPIALIALWFNLIGQGSTSVYTWQGLLKASWPVLIGTGGVGVISAISAYAIYRKWKFLETTLKFGVISASITSLALLFGIKIDWATLGYVKSSVPSLTYLLWTTAVAFAAGGASCAIIERIYRCFFIVDEHEPIDSADETYDFSISPEKSKLRNCIKDRTSELRTFSKFSAGVIGAAACVLLTKTLGWMEGNNIADNDPDLSEKGFKTLVELWINLFKLFGILLCINSFYAFMPNVKAPSFFNQNNLLINKTPEEHPLISEKEQPEKTAPVI